MQTVNISYEKYCEICFHMDAEPISREKFEEMKEQIRSEGR
jgi:hypothetical protein